MSVKIESIDKLLAAIEEAKQEQIYNILDDLKLLKNQYARIKPREFKALLDSVCEKYSTSEAAEVHAALVKKCKAGDANAIKIYHELRAGAGGGDEVSIIDDI